MEGTSDLQDAGKAGGAGLLLTLQDLDSLGAGQPASPGLACLKRGVKCGVFGLLEAELRVGDNRAFVGQDFQ